MKATINIDDGKRTLAAVVGGDVKIIADTHPNFETVYNQVFGELTLSEDGLAELFDLEREVARRFDTLSERVKVAGGTIYFDGDPVHNALTNQVSRFIDEGQDFRPLVAFFEKVMTNPSEHSRDQLFEWLERHRFTITGDGNFIAYKGVSVDTIDGETVYKSISRGNAISDGVNHNGQIPQVVGSVVEMPRSQVQFDPAVGCSVGLHAGTWSYASGFSRGAVLEVLIDPRDVVSVPTDCSAQKIRVCRYKVADVTLTERTTAFYGGYDVEDEFDDEDWDGDFDDEFEVDFSNPFDSPGQFGSVTFTTKEPASNTTSNVFKPGDVVRLKRGESHADSLLDLDLVVKEASREFLYFTNAEGGWLPRRFEHAVPRIGDRVEIISDNEGYLPESVGEVGTIVDVLDDVNYPFRVDCGPGKLWDCNRNEIRPA